VADGWCWFVLREEYCWLVASGWFDVREKHCWLVADKPNEHGAGEEESSDSGIIGDYETPSEYEPSEPRPRRRPEDDDVDYEPSDNEVRMHIHST
jgi:hypothetical protein